MLKWNWNCVGFVLKHKLSFLACGLEIRHLCSFIVEEHEKRWFIQNAVLKWLSEYFRHWD